MEAKGLDQQEYNIKIIKSVLGDEFSDDSIDLALMECNNNVDAAINEILDKPAVYSPQYLVRKKATSTGGARVSAHINPENDEQEARGIKPQKENENLETGSQGTVSVQENLTKRKSFDEADVGPTGLGDMTFEEYCRLNDVRVEGQVKEGRNEEKSIVLYDVDVFKKDEMKEEEEPIMAEPISSRPPSIKNVSPYDRLKPKVVKKPKVDDCMVLSTVVIEDGDFPQEPDWLLVGRTAITGLSTTKGRKLENNEIVHLNFPSGDAWSKYRSQFVSTKAACAVSGIVRFSTTRSGEV